LKKCYFGNYRFSEDLDFSFVGAVNSVDSITSHLEKVCESALQEME